MRITSDEARKDMILEVRDNRLFSAVKGRVADSVYTLTGDNLQRHEVTARASDDAVGPLNLHGLSLACPRPAAGALSAARRGLRLLGGGRLRRLEEFWMLGRDCWKGGENLSQMLPHRSLRCSSLAARYSLYYRHMLPNQQRKGRSSAEAEISHPVHLRLDRLEHPPCMRVPCALSERPVKGLVGSKKSRPVVVARGVTLLGDEPS